MVDLLMVTHNRLEYLKKALPTILEQDYRDFKLLIWDNVSDDATREYLNTISDPRVTIHLNDKNDSLAHVTTSVFWGSEAEFVGKTDPDILLPTNWISRLLDAHSKYHFGFIGALHFFPEDIERFKPRVDDFNGVKIWRKHHIGGVYIIRREDFKGYGGTGVMGLSEYQGEMGYPNGYLWDPILWAEHMEDARSEHYINNDEYNNYKIKVRGEPLDVYQRGIINESYMRENTHE